MVFFDWLDHIDLGLTWLIIDALTLGAIVPFTMWVSQLIWKKKLSNQDPKQHKKTGLYLKLILNFTLYSAAMIAVSSILYPLSKDPRTVILGTQSTFLFLGVYLIYLLTHSTFLMGISFLMGLIGCVAHQTRYWPFLSNVMGSLSLSIGTVTLTPESVIKALVLMAIFAKGASLISEKVKTSIHKTKRFKKNTQELLSKGFDIALYCIGFLILLNILGIHLSTFAVIGGAFGVGIGFGLQKITSNFVSGLILLMEKSIEVDDLIEMEGGVYGYVRRFGARFTLVESFDGKEVLIPNEDFVTNRVTNWTYTSVKGRVEIPIGVSYDADLELAQKLIVQSAKTHPRCINDPEPYCYLREFGDSSVNFLLHFFVDDVTAGRYLIQSEVMFSIWHAFKQHGISIPYPQRDLHIKTTETINRTINIPPDVKD